MRGSQIADNIINGNRAIARAALKRAPKTTLLDTLEDLADHRGGYQGAIEDLRSLLSVK